MSPRIVRQILSREGARRVWLARLPVRGNRYRTVLAPTGELPQFDSFPVAGLACAETPAGRDRIVAGLEPFEPVLWREVPIWRARQVARDLAGKIGCLVHLALFDEPERVVWEPVAATHPR